jgi:DNA-binding NarL/FixJ family response regulator
VLLADDHAIVAEGLRRVLETNYEVIGVVSNGQAVLAAAEQFKPDVIVMDVSMPLLNGIGAARRIHKTSQNVKIVFLSMHTDIAYVTEAFRAGASAYILKVSAPAEILTAVGYALQGKTYLSRSIDRAKLEAQLERGQRSRQSPKLSPRQREVLQLVAEGRPRKLRKSCMFLREPSNFTGTARSAQHCRAGTVRHQTPANLILTKRIVATWQITYFCELDHLFRLGTIGWFRGRTRTRQTGPNFKRNGWCPLASTTTTSERDQEGKA